MPRILIKMGQMKVCAVCASEHHVVPEMSRVGGDGLHYWECKGLVERDGAWETCNSTLVYAPSYSKAAEVIARAKARREGARV